ncbi:MAG: type II secretion system F family protein [Puniceicoccales bacterium]|jgi:type II secretory pathway component PulF|nr:type II secretion system F family protein [Puniceicoccales bacterium]
MPGFIYKTLDAAGRPHNGALEAPDRRTAARRLAAQGLRVLSLASEGTVADAHDTAPAAPLPDPADPHASVADLPPPAKLTRARLFGPHQTGRDFLDSFQQLHASGLPMGDAVKLLAQRVSDPALRHLCQDFWRSMSEGATLASAMSAYPAVFDSGTLHMVEAGENTGNLTGVLRKLLQSYELRETLRSKVLSSIGYPAGVCCMAIGVLCLFVFALIPRIEQIMAGMGGKFPPMVSGLVLFSNLLVKGGPFLLIGAALLLLFFLRWRKTESGRLRSDGWFLRIPIVGRILTHSETTRMTDLLATLMGSGVNATDSLRLCERPVANRVLRARLNEGRQMINDGAAFASAFKRHQILPAQDLDILAVGENTGSLAETFQTIARRHLDALDRSIARLVRVITAIVLTGTVSLVFICVISIILSILSVSQSISRPGI